MFKRKKSDTSTFFFKRDEPVYFASIISTEQTPSNSAIEEKEFYLVKYKRKHIWALFKCPCGCGQVISLSVQKVHPKSWSVKKSRGGRPILYPSVWQNIGCWSHFWINDGKVYWFSSTGTSPWSKEYNRE